MSPDLQNFGKEEECSDIRCHDANFGNNHRDVWMKKKRGGRREEVFIPEHQPLAICNICPRFGKSIKRGERAATQANSQKHHRIEKCIFKDVESAFETEVAKSSETQNIVLGGLVFV